MYGIALTSRFWAYILRHAVAFLWRLRTPGTGMYFHSDSTVYLVWSALLPDSALSFIPCATRYVPPRGYCSIYARWAGELDFSELVHYQILPNTGHGGARHDMEPTNNHSERTMRFVVGRRNVRMQACSLRGVWRRNTLWTCISTWGCAASRYTVSCGGALPKGPWRIHDEPKRIHKMNNKVNLMVVKKRENPV